MSSPKLDKDLFFRRLKRIYEAWNNPSDEDEQLGQLGTLIIDIGVDEETTYSKTKSLHFWLFGYELTDTIMIFTKEELHILSSKSKIEFIKSIEHQKENQDLPHIKLIVRDKSDKDKKNIEKLIEIVSRDDQKSFGEFSKDRYKNDFIVEFRKNLQELNFQSIDITAQFAYIMAVKEENEIETIRKACGVTVEIFNKFVKDQLTNIIDSEKRVKHSKFGDSIEKTIEDKKYTKNLDRNMLEMCYTPIIQSGGNYNLKFSAENDKNNIHFGAIICGLGTRYKQYCTNIVRTILVSPTEEQQKIYEFLLELEEKALQKLADGVRICDVYNAIINLAQSKDEALVDKLTKNFGFAIGLEFREGSLLITSKNRSRLRKGMVFNLAIGFSNLRNAQASDDSGKNYALFIGDTVLVNEAGTPAEILTLSKKRIKNIAIFLKEIDEESEEESEKEEIDEHVLVKGGRRNAVLENKLRQEQTAEEKRKIIQKELAERLNKEALERLERKQGPEKEEKARKAAISYKSFNQMPKDDLIKELKIFVDKTYETVVLPIFGIPTPFHISTIKNISSSVEGDYTYLRVNFFHPGSTLNKNDQMYGSPDATFLKEITYRSTNVKEPGEISAPSSNLNHAFRLIKDVQKKFRTREAEEKEKEGIVKQDSLILSQSKGNPKLKDLYIKPNLYSKRISGMLEAHVNGFRFTSIRGDKVDILYNNIKHAFYQPCDKEMIILIHFTLKNAIMFGKKKHVDVQFYTEVGEITTDLGKHQNMHDRDDLAAEQAERELRQKLKSAFRLFCDKVEQVKPDFDFEMPIRELGFQGVPYRNTVFLQPTSSCLVHLTEWPPFVIALDEIELVHFERVNFQLKSFDMVFVFKDYSRKVSNINAIPTSSLDSIKGWLTQAEIRYTEGPISLNWTKIMKTIVEDPKHFFETGGWSFLDPQSDAEEDDEEEDEEDDKYEPSNDESEADESETDESEEEFTDSENYSDEEMASSEEEGLDWDELEEEARKADKEKDFEQHHTGGAGGGTKRRYEESPKSSNKKSKKHR